MIEIKIAVLSALALTTRASTEKAITSELWDEEVDDVNSLIINPVLFSGNCDSFNLKQVLSLFLK